MVNKFTRPGSEFRKFRTAAQRYAEARKLAGGAGIPPATSVPMKSMKASGVTVAHAELGEDGSLRCAMCGGPVRYATSTGRGRDHPPKTGDVSHLTNSEDFDELADDLAADDGDAELDDEVAAREVSARAVDGSPRNLNASYARVLREQRRRRSVARPIV